MVAVTEAVPLFTAVKAAMSPVPLAASPIEVLSLVQLYTVPATAPVKATAVVLAPLQRTWFDTTLTVGVGFTVMVNVIGVPVQVTPPFV
jgi:hypothetical protein